MEDLRERIRTHLQNYHNTHGDPASIEADNVIEECGVAHHRAMVAHAERVIKAANDRISELEDELQAHRNDECGRTVVLYEKRKIEQDAEYAKVLDALGGTLNVLEAIEAEDIKAPIWIVEQAATAIEKAKEILT